MSLNVSKSIELAELKSDLRSKNFLLASIFSAIPTFQITVPFLKNQNLIHLKSL